MITLTQIERAVRELSAGERAALLRRLGAEREETVGVAEPRAAASAAERRLFTFEEYLDIERGSPLRHEYVAGEILAMGEPLLPHLRGRKEAALPMPGRAHRLLS